MLTRISFSSKNIHLHVTKILAFDFNGHFFRFPLNPHVHHSQPWTKHKPSVLAKETSIYLKPLLHEQIPHLHVQLRSF